MRIRFVSEMATRKHKKFMYDLFEKKAVQLLEIAFE